MAQPTRLTSTRRTPQRCARRSTSTSGPPGRGVPRAAAGRPRRRRRGAGRSGTTTSLKCESGLGATVSRCQAAANPSGGRRAVQGCRRALTATADTRLRTSPAYSATSVRVSRPPHDFSTRVVRQSQRNAVRCCFHVRRVRRSVRTFGGRFASSAAWSPVCPTAGAGVSHQPAVANQPSARNGGYRTSHGPRQRVVVSPIVRRCMEHAAGDRAPLALLTSPSVVVITGASCRARSVHRRPCPERWCSEECFSRGGGPRC